MPEGRPALSTAQPALVTPPAERVEPVLSARDDVDREDGGGPEKSKIARGPNGAASPEDDESGPDGLTEDQRAKLAAARQKKPRGGFWIKVLSIFIIVAGLLMLVQQNMPLQGLDNANSVSKQPADVGEVDAKRIPADPAKGGHIVGGESPAQ
jgi:hypothetical protein